MRKRHGFTLCELLVVVVIVGLLVALMLPAVQLVREASRRSSCANNLRMIGLALHQFENNRGFTPPGALDSSANRNAAQTILGVEPAAEHGWVVFLLPHLEQAGINLRYDFRYDWRSPQNREARETSLGLFRCPSTPLPERIDRGSSGGFAWQAAVSDYGVINGIAGNLYGAGLVAQATHQAPDGMLRANVLPRLAENRDGLSNTVWIAEDCGRPHRYRAEWRKFPGRTSGAGWADRDNDFLLHGSNRSGESSSGPCAVNCTNANEVYSFHPAGAQLLFGDGSVRMVCSDVEIRLLAALITIAAGEVVPRLP
jgi:prepilin-type N-terminal cleavage/methylation domain-containing protein